MNTTETTETDNSFLKDMAGKIKAGAIAAATGLPGQIMNIDADGDGDTILNDKNNDGTMLSRFISRITGGGGEAEEFPENAVGSSANKYGRDKSAAPFKLKKYK